MESIIPRHCHISFKKPRYYLVLILYILINILSTSFSLSVVVSASTFLGMVLWLVGQLITFSASFIVMKTMMEKESIVTAYMSFLGMTLYQFAFTIASYFNSDMVSATGTQIIAPLPFYLVIFFFFGFLFTNKVLKGNSLHITKNMVILATLTMFPIDLFNHILYAANNYNSSNKMLVYSASFAYLCCVLVLYGIRIMNHQSELSNENAIVSDMLKKSEIEYQISSSNIDYLNKTTHDLMHKLSGLYALDKKEERAEYLDEISSSLSLYDSFFDTKNKALDTILSEKKIFCTHNDITFKCFINGADFDFISLPDIYAILNGPLDNVISHVSKIFVWIFTNPATCSPLQSNITSTAFPI